MYWRSATAWKTFALVGLRSRPFSCPMSGFARRSSSERPRCCGIFARFRLPTFIVYISLYISSRVFLKVFIRIYFSFFS